MPAKLLAVLCLSLLIAGCAPTGRIEPPPRPSAGAGSEAGGTVWKALVVAGSDQEPVFDNARRRVVELLVASGVQRSHIRQLSASPAAVGKEPGLRLATAANIETSLHELAPGPNEGCLVYLTSHGNQNGLALREARAFAPSQLADMLRASCGERPTIVVASACFSGVFINDATVAPNRIILTAANSTRPSFGCSPQRELNYWDGCFIENFQTAGDWTALAGAIRSCVETEEKVTGAASSFPQSFIGRSMRDLKIGRGT
jgi:hypothetical protein